MHAHVVAWCICCAGRLWGEGGKGTPDIGLGAECLGFNRPWQPRRERVKGAESSSIAGGDVRCQGSNEISMQYFGVLGKYIYPMPCYISLFPGSFRLHTATSPLCGATEPTAGGGDGYQAETFLRLLEENSSRRGVLVELCAT